MKRYLHLSLLALIGLGLAACDSNDDDGDDLDLIRVGTSKVKIEGATTDAFNGYAFFSIVEDADEGEEPTFALFLADVPNAQDEIDNLVYFIREGTRPGTGTYTLDGDDASAFLLAVVGGEDVIAPASEGTLTLTASSSERVRGSFSFAAMAVGSGAEITVSGTFDAPFVRDVDDYIED